MSMPDWRVYRGQALAGVGEIGRVCPDILAGDRAPGAAAARTGLPGAEASGFVALAGPCCVNPAEVVSGPLLRLVQARATAVGMPGLSTVSRIARRTRTSTTWRAGPRSALPGA